MTITAPNLTKGSRVNLSKAAPSLTSLRLALTWGENKFDTGADYDLDCSVFMLTANAAGEGKLARTEDFVFYNNLKSADGSVVHAGDNRTGSAAVDDEVITVDLTKVPASISEISFIVTIFEAEERKQNFGQIPGSKIELFDATTFDPASRKPVATYALEEDFSTETAVQFGSLYRNAQGEWAFKAVGAGYRKGLGDFVNIYSA
jgi:tellurium resistance protein TerD